ncbi:site-specific integrase [Granulosicoccus antarcticus]|uniref:Tyrosine recombinase XerC n=1 Tax=Granulosicoccus antarcticus IMCC3135 TaxID=1192854 RepID=A0A2Z2NQB9_9GAMM|nr:site-specific integrase [Granulosicoccus antarcticus]ASJ73429.1 Tyrosine recombinase XerC [Granulosicoccus antarcticus IMCC3135]
MTISDKVTLTGEIDAPESEIWTVEGRPSPALTTALDSARDYATASRSDATWRAYAHDWQRFASWCESVGQSALPASASTICAFLATEADAGLAAATLDRRLAAIRVVHQGNQQTSAHDAPAVREVMRGIRNRQKGRPSPKKAPLIDTDLTLLVDTMDTTTLAGARDRALLLIGFAAALRRSELVGIDVEHLAFRPEGLTLMIPFSKTDQAGKGAQIAVPAIPLSDYCPVAALKAWLAVAGLTEGAVFRRLRRGPRVGQDRLSDSTVAKLIKQCAKNAGHENVSMFAGHSLRRGFITTAARNRADVFAIAAQSRHRSLDTVREYVDAETRFDNHPGLKMFQ